MNEDDKARGVIMCRLPVLLLLGVLFSSILLHRTVSVAQEPHWRTDLSRLSFPLPEQPTFEEDMEFLGDVIAAKIRRPAATNGVRDRSFTTDEERILALVADWSSPKFREPLIEHLRTKPNRVYECADALLRYNDDGLRAVVKTREDYSRTECDGGCFASCWTYSVTDLLKRPRPLRSAFGPLDTMLPLRADDSWIVRLDWQPGITVPESLSQLSHPVLSVRLQAWCWLAEQGIVAPTDPVVESWSDLVDYQRWYIVERTPTFVGRERLLRLFDRLSSQPPDKFHTHLFRRRVELGSEPARAEARRIVHAAIKTDDPVTAMKEEHAQSALRALCERPDVADIPVLIRIFRSFDEFDGHVAILGLLCVDHPDAIDEIVNGLCGPRVERTFMLGWSAQHESARIVKHRAYYLKRLADGIQRMKDVDATDSLVDLLDTFSCVSDQDFGWTGREQHGDIDDEAAKEAAKKYLRWYVDHAPKPERT